MIFIKVRVCCTYLVAFFVSAARRHYGAYPEKTSSAPSPQWAALTHLTKYVRFAPLGDVAFRSQQQKSELAVTP